jgi:ABC-2 type transport system ATP-binding protein
MGTAAWTRSSSRRIGKRRVDEVLDIVGLAGASGKRAGAFSLGMSQRLSLAAALLGDPPVLLLDEPVNGLDPEGIRWLRDLLRRLAAEGRTVFVSSHLMAEMAMTADHVIVIGKGRLLADTSTADFVERNARTVVRVRSPEPERLQQVLSAAGILATPAADGGFEASGATSAQISQLATANGLTLDELSTHVASLEEAFLKLTTAGSEGTR